MRMKPIPTWKFCIALIREYGLFGKLVNLDFTRLQALANHTIKLNMKNGESITVQYRNIDKILRTTATDRAAAEYAPIILEIEKEPLPTINSTAETNDVTTA